MVQKSRLIEKIAELLNDKKLPLIADIRDESAEDIRVVIEPRTRTVEPAILMEQLFKLTELESRFSMNMNVLVDGLVPRVISLKEALQQWLDHRRNVLLRRSRFRHNQIERRLEVLAGMLIVFLNLDEVIRIIREEDEPKDALKARFALSDLQANYILDTRLRSLRRLEEMELRREHDKLEKEKAEIEKLLASDAKQWKTITGQIRELQKKFAQDTPLGRRRTTFEEAPDVADFDLATSMVEREPVTIVVSEKGWIRALKGHLAELPNLQFKGDDRFKSSFFAETTSKILVLTTDGKIFTLEASKLPGGRGQGEPIRLMADLGEGEDIVSVFPYVPAQKMLLAAKDARGFILSQDDMVAGTRKGKQILNCDAPAKAFIIVPASGDHVATIGENRKLLVFPLAQIPEMARGKGVRLQRYKDGGISDAKVFALKDGLSWKDPAGRTFNVAKAELTEWIGERAEAGRLPPRGFPKNNRFE
jgi:topoisomerase-4 subunit A